MPTDLARSRSSDQDLRPSDSHEVRRTRGSAVHQHQGGGQAPHISVQDRGGLHPESGRCIPDGEGEEEAFNIEAIIIIAI